MTALPAADPPTPFATGAPIYRNLGWTGTIPLPTGEKGPPPVGTTGHNGKDPDDTTVQAWAAQEPTANLALRLPDNLTGIDVDNYNNKTGATTLTHLEHELGELPPTWRSSARPHPSGIRLYKIPAGTRLQGKAGPHIDIVQHHHRFIVAWPSTNPKATDRPYLWYRPDGTIADRPPAPHELPDLPEPWLNHLRQPEPGQTTITRNRVIIPGDMTDAVKRALGAALLDLHGNRHDTAMAAVTALTRLHHQNHPGANNALEQLRHAFHTATTSDGTRTDREATNEWERMTRAADQLVQTTPNLRPTYNELTAHQPTDTSWIGKTETTTPHLTLVPPPDEWPEPTPINNTPTTTLPPFPLHTLPDWITNAVTDISTALQVPVDLPAHIAIGCLSTIATGHAKIKLRGSRWTEDLNTYIAVAMPPGSGKSPAFKAMSAPIRQLEQTLRNNTRQQIRDATNTRNDLEGRIKNAIETLRKIDDPTSTQYHQQLKKLGQLQDKLEQTTIPPDPQLFADDATPESLVTMMGTQNGRLAILSSEGGIFDAIAGQYTEKGSKVNLDVYVKGHSGDSLRRTRIKGDPVDIERALLTICVTTQNAVIESMAGNAEAAKRGVPARFMYSIPQGNIGYRDRSKVYDEHTGNTTINTWQTQLLTLGQQMAAWTHPATIETNEEARQLFHSYDTEIEAGLREDGPYHDLPEWSQKLRSTILRIAGLLHLATDHTTNEPLDATTMANAIEIGRYWMAHAQAVHQTWTHGATNDTHQLLLSIAKKIDKTGEHTLTPRDIGRLNSSLTKRLGGTSGLAPLLRELVDNHWARELGGATTEVGKHVKGIAFQFHPNISSEMVAEKHRNDSHCRVVALSLKGEFLTTTTTQKQSPPEPPPPRDSVTTRHKPPHQKTTHRDQTHNHVQTTPARPHPTDRPEI